MCLDENDITVILMFCFFKSGILRARRGEVMIARDRHLMARLWVQDILASLRPGFREAYAAWQATWLANRLAQPWKLQRSSADPAG